VLASKRTERFDGQFIYSSTTQSLSSSNETLGSIRLTKERKIIAASQVTDTNDNAPTFQSTAYSFDVPENVPRGSRVGQVIAQDADAEGPNSQLSYVLISDWANDVFSLNPNTGVFTLTASLDYEQVGIAARAFPESRGRVSDEKFKRCASNTRFKAE